MRGKGLKAESDFPVTYTIKDSIYNECMVINVLEGKMEGNFKPIVDW